MKHNFLNEVMNKRLSLSSWAIGIIILNLLTISSSFANQDVDVTHKIVETLYAPYLADPHAENPHKINTSAEDRIRPYAANSLQKLIDANDACEMRSHEICSIDMDILIGGQDWDLSNFSIGNEAAQENKRIVAVHFKNGGAVTVRFFFVQEGGVWKIDDVEDDTFCGPDISQCHPLWLKKALQT